MITVEGLSFGYTKTPFLKHISFTVPQGEILGFLGPSGAGKSTLQKILIGMLPRYEGRVTVLGQEARAANSAFYEQIGIAFEFPTLYEKLTGRQNLAFFASLYRRPARDIGAQEVLHLGLRHDGQVEHERLFEPRRRVTDENTLLKPLGAEPRGEQAVVKAAVPGVAAAQPIEQHDVAHCGRPHEVACGVQCG